MPQKQGIHPRLEPHTTLKDRAKGYKSADVEVRAAGQKPMLIDKVKDVICKYAVEAQTELNPIDLEKFK